MKTLIGKITSNKMQNTVAVEIESLWEHPVYKKRIKHTTKILAHTDKKLKEGQTVMISETKPVSKRKAWKVVEVVAK